MFKTKGSGYYWALIVLLICFSIIGNFIYENTRDYMIQPYEVYNPEENSQFDLLNNKQDTIVLEGGHEYTIYTSLKLGARSPVEHQFTAKFTFNETGELEKTQIADKSETFFASLVSDYRTEAFHDPIYLENDETLKISVSTVLESDIIFEIRIYQDFDYILVNPYPFIIGFVIICILLWTQAYDIFEKPFREYEAKKELKTVKVKNELKENPTNNIEVKQN